jgi:hypothetical protein
VVVAAQHQAGGRDRDPGDPGYPGQRSVLSTIQILEEIIRGVTTVYIS